jgi:hypothetical protein
MDKKIDPEKIFNWQIQKANKTGNEFFIKQALLNRELFLISKNLTIEDWRKIRTGDYYIKRDQSVGNLVLNPYIPQMQFIISRIKKYLNL